MNQPLDEAYLPWLYQQIGDPDAPPSRSFWKLARRLYTEEFFWWVPNDDNRADDGRLLRYEFIDDLDLTDVDPDWLDLGCSMLELLIGLARRLAFLADGEASTWFWHLIDNLGLRYSDRKRIPEEVISNVLNTVIWRTYRPNGAGGLFPLQHAERDQRDVELWYQLNAYLLER